MSKKAGGAAKKSAPDEDDDSTQRILKIYKRKCEQNGISPNKLFTGRVEHIVSENEHLEKMHLWEEIFPVGIRAIFETLEEVEYKHLKSIRLWKTQTENEGVRTIAKFLQKSKNLQCLDLLENGVTALGCEFLGKQVLHPMNMVPLIKLKLDHNPIRLEGLRNLAEGLSVNPTITSLSLNYCGLPAESVKYLQQIIGFIDTSLEKLKLQGNLLQNSGVFQLFRALEGNSKLEKLNIADNQFSQDSSDIDLIPKICDIMKKNTTLGSYDFRYNGIYDESAREFLMAVGQGKHIFDLKMNEHIAKDISEDLKALMKKNKPKKKKRKGKKGGKKKKKKK